MGKKKDSNLEISASELNKFTYCNYQWYYEKIYGSKHINKMRKEMLEELGYEDSAKSNFVKGQEFHNNYDDSFRLGIGSNLILSIILVIAIIFIIYYFSQ